MKKIRHKEERSRKDKAAKNERESMQHDFQSKPEQVRGRLAIPLQGKPELVSMIKILGDSPQYEADQFEENIADKSPNDLPPGKKRRRSELGLFSPTNAVDKSAELESTEHSDLVAKGVRLLAMREHSVSEMRRKLADKSENHEIIEAVIDDLQQRKYLSDERFTESFIRSRRNRGIGPIKIKSELKAKGINNVLIQDKLNLESAVWFDLALEQYKKKFADSPVEDYKSWSKRARFLQGRGFTMDQIHCVVSPPEEV